MNEQTNNQPVNQGMSLEKKLKYTFIGVALVSGLAYLGYRLIKNKEKASADANSFQPGSPEAIASQIKLALENSWRPGINLTQLRKLLIAVPTLQQMSLIRQAYKDQYDKLMNEDIKSHISVSEFDELLAIMDTKPENPGQVVPMVTRYKAWAKRLDAAFRKTYGIFSGTDQEAITAVFVEVPTQQAFIEVGKSYNTQFKPKDFITELKSELGGDYLTYMQIITKKPPR